MSKLKAINPTTAPASKPKIMIYGKPGVGKTWGSMDFPNVFYIDTESGGDLPHYMAKLKNSGGGYFGVEQGSMNFNEVIGQIQALATEKHEYKTVVIDSISKIFAVAIADEAERLGDKNAFGADKKPAIQHMRKLVSWLSRIDMNVIITAHEKPMWGIDKKGERAEIGVTFDAWEKLEYELHLVLNIFKAGPDHKARVTKSRLAEFFVGDVFEWSYAEFSKRYGKIVMEAAPTQIVLPSADQLQEIKRLVELVNLPEKTVEKWLKSANAESWDEMDAPKLQKCIEFIHATIIKGETK